MRRQYKEHPDILEYKTQPNYRYCVEIVTRAGLREMVLKLKSNRRLGKAWAAFCFNSFDFRINFKVYQ